MARTTLRRWIDEEQGEPLRDRLPELATLLQVPEQWLVGDYLPPPAPAACLLPEQLVETFAYTRESYPAFVRDRTRLLLGGPLRPGGLVLCELLDHPPRWIARYQGTAAGGRVRLQDLHTGEVQPLRRAALDLQNIFAILPG